MSAAAWDTATWSLKLADRYFSPAFGGEAVTFAVDPDSLSSIAGLDAASAQEALCTAVRQEVMPGHRFDRVGRATSDWRRCGASGPPPSLPLLAVTVLAAASMDASNFYGPLRRLLDPSDMGKGIPPSFDDHIPRLWRELRWWLNDHLDGARGIATITDPGFYVNIGYSVQQAALRTPDRRLLFQFFRRIGLVPAEEQILPGELRRALGVWAKGQGQRGLRLLRLATDPSLEQHAEILLADVARTWDGRLRDPISGFRAAPLRLLLERRPLRLGWIAPRGRDQPPSMQLDPPHSDTELIADGRWWTPRPSALRVDAEHLAKGLELSGAGQSFFHEAAPAIPLRLDPDQYEFVSVDRVIYGEPHLLLVSSTIRASVESWIDREGLAARLDPMATRHMPQGWFLIRDFYLDSRPAHEPPTAVVDLLGSAGGGRRVRLSGGLKLRHLGQVYLSGGGPDIALPNTVEHPTFTIRTTGFDPIERVAEAGCEFQLSRFDLPPGQYEVDHGGVALRFQMVDGVAATPPDGVGTVRSAGRDGREAAGLVVDGPSTSRPGSLNVPPVGFDVGIAIGPSPEDVEIVQLPRWIERIDGPLTWSSAERWKPFDATWLLIPVEGRSTAYDAHPVGVVPPRSSAGGGTWARLILNAQVACDASETAEQLWLAYVQAATGD